MWDVYLTVVFFFCLFQGTNRTLANCAKRNSPSPATWERTWRPTRVSIIFNIIIRNTYNNHNIVFIIMWACRLRLSWPPYASLCYPKNYIRRVHGMIVIIIRVSASESAVRRVEGIVLIFSIFFLLLFFYLFLSLQCISAQSLLLSRRY